MSVSVILGQLHGKCHTSAAHGTIARLRRCLFMRETESAEDSGMLTSSVHL